MRGSLGDPQRRRAQGELAQVLCARRVRSESWIEHTLKAFDSNELHAIERRIAEMGGIAEKMVVDTTDAFANADTVLDHQVVATDPRLDAL